MLYKVLAFMKATTLKSLWVELTKTLIDKDGNRETDGITNKQTNKQITSTERNASSQAYSPSSTQQTPSVFWYSVVRHFVHRRPPLGSVSYNKSYESG
jgi:hypothetical protein